MTAGKGLQLTKRLMLAGFILAGTFAFAQTERTSAFKPHSKAENEKWPAFFRYSVTSDYADNRTPRGYTHSFGGSVSYNFTPKWSLGLEAELRAETISGQIEKGTEESHSDVLNPAASLELAYSDKILSRHSYSLFTHGAALFDAPSQREGYKGIVGAGGSLTLSFFGRAYSVTNSLDASSLLNTFSYNANAESNPDYFYTYRLDNSLRFWGSYKFTVSFGAKITRYMDGFTGYSYNSALMLSRSWNNVTLGARYVNGGFTDEGRVNLWYIDEYRRVASLMANYAF